VFEFSEGIFSLSRVEKIPPTNIFLRLLVVKNCNTDHVGLSSKKKIAPNIFSFERWNDAIFFVERVKTILPSPFSVFFLSPSTSEGISFLSLLKKLPNKNFCEVSSGEKLYCNATWLLCLLNVNVFEGITLETLGSSPLED